MPRNLFPDPCAIGTAWSGDGGSGGSFTPNLAVTGMDRGTAGRTTRGGVTGNSRVYVEPYVSATDLGGLPFSVSLQLEADPAPQRSANPVCAVDATNWAGFSTGSGYSSGRVTGLSGMVASTGFRVTNGAAGQLVLYAGRGSVSPGEQVTAALQARPSAATTVQWCLIFRNSAGAEITSAQVNGAAVSVAANAATFGRVSGTAPAGAASAEVALVSGSVAAGATLTATGHRVDAVTDPAMESAVTLSCAVELNFRDAGGARLGAVVTGAPVILTSGGAPARAYANGGTAPAGTRKVEVVGLFRVSAAGQRVYATAGRCDQVSDSALAYYDRLSPGWISEGAPGSSASCDGWRADLEASSTATDALAAGYTGTQRQTNDEPIQNGGTPIPVVAAPFSRPGRALQVTLPDPPAQRLESNPHQAIQFGSGEDWWFGFAFALGAGFPTWPDDYIVIDQLHGAPGTGSPPISFETRQYSLRLRGGDNRPKSDAGDNYGSAYAYNVPLLQNLRVNRWYAVVYHLVLSDQIGGGSLDVWVDGVQRLAGFAPPPGSVYGTTEFPNTGGKTYRKQGLYKRPALPGGTVWHAGAAVGRSYAAVDPTRPQLVATSDSMAPVAA